MPGDGTTSAAPKESKIQILPHCYLLRANCVYSVTIAHHKFNSHIQICLVNNAIQLPLTLLIQVINSVDMGVDTTM